MNAPELLDELARDAAFAPWLKKLRSTRRRKAIAVGEANEAAWPVLAALAARAGEYERTWVIAADVARAERAFAAIQPWVERARLLPSQDKPLATASDGQLLDPESTAEHLGFFQWAMESTGPRVAVLAEDQLTERVATPGELARLEVEFAKGGEHDRDTFVEQLQEVGYERVAQVTARGEFATRGGILDLFPWNTANPIRIEWWDNEVDSIRAFDLDSQLGIDPVERVRLILQPPPEQAEQVELRDLFDKNDLVVAFGLSGLEEADLLLEEKLDAAGPPLVAPWLEAEPPAFGDPQLSAAKQAERQKALERLGAEGWSLVTFSEEKLARSERMKLLEHDIEKRYQQVAHCDFEIGTSLLFPRSQRVWISIGQWLGKDLQAIVRRRLQSRDRFRRQRAPIDFAELIEGDYVVHLEHGIALYQGLSKAEDRDGNESEVMVLEFAGHARLYVPIREAHLLSRYVGLGKKHPPLSKLGENRWSQSKRAAMRAAESYAERLLRLQAEREVTKRPPFPPDHAWQHDFESGFPYTETADQVKAISATKHDMEEEQPMDRLICGDVGFGKTEVAIRAAFKAVMAGKQVAMLAPTTVLAQQHFENFRARMAEFPIRVEVISRFRSRKEQKAVLEDAKVGAVDILIGTHRLIQNDVKFQNLGLVVVDEEQRFGVLHKERMKERYRNVDLLTLSATPIPRTLYMALTGVRNMSTIETPPPGRVPVETLIAGYDERLIREAIARELARGGQIYFLHNRVHSIEGVRERLQLLVPDARIGIGHGQMTEDELEAVMRRFVEGHLDILVSTTIIESGLDIPNANTIIIDRADLFGLADLYQLRGRVGRGIHKAYALLLLPRSLMLGNEARKRVSAIQQYSNLGAGFRIAMRDLEIRGAGNLLGTAQSGHITAVGFELYCKLLRDAVDGLKGQRKRQMIDVSLVLDFVEFEEQPGEIENEEGAYLPSHYIEEPGLRMRAYREVAELRNQKEIDQLERNWRDRFGRLPVEASNLLLCTRIRNAAAHKRVHSVEVKNDRIMLMKRGDYLQVGGKFPRLTAHGPIPKLRELYGVVKRL